MTMLFRVGGLTIIGTAVGIALAALCVAIVGVDEQDRIYTFTVLGAMGALMGLMLGVALVAVGPRDRSVAQSVSRQIIWLGISAVIGAAAGHLIGRHYFVHGAVIGLVVGVAIQRMLSPKNGQATADDDKTVE